MAVARGLTTPEHFTVISSSYSRLGYIDGPVPLLAATNALSLIIPGISWRLGNHPGWYVGSLGRRPMSVSVADGSPVLPDVGTLNKRHR